MSQFRSEEMNLVQLFVQSDAAHDTLHELGQIGAIQFKDVRALSPAQPAHPRRGIRARVYANLLRRAAARGSMRSVLTGGWRCVRL
jgi:hypothetical protein